MPEQQLQGLWLTLRRSNVEGGATLHACRYARTSLMQDASLMQDECTYRTICAHAGRDYNGT